MEGGIHYRGMSDEQSSVDVQDHKVLIDLTRIMGSSAERFHHFFFFVIFIWTVKETGFSKVDYTQSLMMCFPHVLYLFIKGSFHPKGF